MSHQHNSPKTYQPWIAVLIILVFGIIVADSFYAGKTDDRISRLEMQLNPNVGQDLNGNSYSNCFVGIFATSNALIQTVSNSAAAADYNLNYASNILAAQIAYPQSQAMPCRIIQATNALPPELIAEIRAASLNTPTNGIYWITNNFPGDWTSCKNTNSMPKPRYGDAIALWAPNDWHHGGLMIEYQDHEQFLGATRDCPRSEFMLVWSVTNGFVK